MSQELSREKMDKLREKAHARLMPSVHQAILARVPRLTRAQLDTLTNDPQAMDKFVRDVGDVELVQRILHESETGGALAE